MVRPRQVRYQAALRPDIIASLILNHFHELPEIIAGALFNRVVNFLTPRLPATIDVRLAVVMIGGAALILAALLMLRVQDSTDPAKA